MKRKGWIIAGVVVGVWLLFIVAVGAIAFALFSGGGSGFGQETIEGSGTQKVALIRIDGAITGGRSSPGLLSGATTGAEDVIAQLRQAQQDPEVEAVLLRLETPGGEVVASDDIYKMVRRVNKTKPVLSSMGGLAASGGYYIAAGTRRIVANPATLTGSIGVIMTIPNVAQAAGKLGVRPEVIKSGAFKDAGSMYRDMTPAERELFQALIDEAYQQFLQAVAQGRGKSVDQIRPVADGRVLSGIQAKAAGLVDEFGDLHQAYLAALRVAKLDEDGASLVEYTQPGGLLGSLTRLRSPVKQVRSELGLNFGMQYLYVP